MNMSLAAYNTWVQLFDEDVSEVWRFERYELQKITMLMTALRKEIKNVYSSVESELKKLRLQLEHKDALEEISKSSPKNKNGIQDKENINVHTGNREPNSTLDSPDLFKVIDQNISNSSSTIIDLSLSDDSLAITKTDCSPPLNKRKKQYKHCKITKPANSHVQEGMRFPRDISFDAEESVIAGTPEVSSNKETSKTQRKVRKKRNTTLTQIFRRVSDNQHLMDTDDGNDSDETRIDDRATQGLTELLNCINDNKTDAADIQRENDPLLRSAVFNDSDIASPRNDAFSNAALFNDSDIASPQGIPNKKQKVEAEPIVRGKARALLAGFSCQQCQDFYGKMNLSPEELKEKIDACSRHRYMYKPPPDTLPGFWDLTVTSQEDENKDH